MSNTSINLKLGKKSYDILIGNNLIEKALFEELVKNRHVMLVYDQNLDSKKVEDFLSMYSELGATKSISIGLEASEENKSYESVQEIQNCLIENQYSRDCLLIGFGGGIICDLVGFSASTYQRGVDFALIPTTLLAQVDASVGGKTAINHIKGKNMIGSFHQPVKVFIDTNFLSTLPEREIKSGMVEMVKHGIIWDENYLKWLEKNVDKITALSEPFMVEAIKKSVEIKSTIVSQDEKESGIRAILNFGHTFGHGIELIGKYKEYNHGEAVALGMLYASKLSEITEDLPKESVERISSFFKKVGIKTTALTKIDPEELYSAMQSDKKKQGNELNFIVLNKIGKAKKVTGISKETVLEVLK